MLLPRLKCLLLAAVVFCSGCAANLERPTFLEPVPSKGGAISPSVWAAADEAPDNRGLDRMVGRWWLWPFAFKWNQLEVATDHQQARRTGFSWLDLSTPLLMTFLPLHVTYSRDYYRRGEDAPAGKMRFYWNILWTHARESGGVQDSTKLRAWGVPLLFSRVTGTHRQRDMKFTWNTTLWTLGPSLITWRDEDGWLERGWFFSLAQLGGILGPLVWFDYAIKTQDGRSATAHGPLFGYLGFAHAHHPYFRGQRPVFQEERSSQDPPKFEEVESLERTHTMLLLGILWDSVNFRDEEGRIVKGRNGPLWGVLGWGAKDGGFAVRFLWMNIRLGKKNPDMVKYRPTGGERVIPAAE